ncbi:MAG: (4Fe-4S)-binding protein [Propionicimonas sp.]|nr:(4Fe-4S)-binding protein [Propionicimonas sp.]
MTRKHYLGPIVDVSFDGAVCAHAAECVRGMPAVFDTGRRPWIDPGVATTPELAERLRTVVGRCPSGALRIEEHRAHEQREQQ